MFLEGKAKIIGVISIIVISILLFTCEQDVKKYVVISHTRLDDNSGINSYVANANLSEYDVLLLGGDLANLSSYDDSILKYLDSKFDISSPKTLWALGNHDYYNVDLLKRYTKKETYYSYVLDNTVFMVLDTELDSSRISGEQLVFFNSVIDTISNYDNLIVLTHKLIWMRGNNKLEGMIDTVSNGHYGDCSYCIQENNFYIDIYPKLTALSNVGFKVFCVAGDIGFKAKQFQYYTEEGINFLATGVRKNESNNYYIEFWSHKAHGTLTYEFKLLESLPVIE